MASKQAIVRQLNEHFKRGADLLAAWDGASDYATAHMFDEQERDHWRPTLKVLINRLDPALVVRYDMVSPFEYPSQYHLVLIQWPDIEAGYRCLRERLHRLRADVLEFARAFHVDLSADDAPAVRFANARDTERAYDEHVETTRGETGRAPTTQVDFAWGKRHGLGRDRMCELRGKSPVRTEKDKRGGNPNFAKN